MAEIPLATTMPTVAAIYAAYEASQGDGYRNHLGASSIGAPCDRAVVVVPLARLLGGPAADRRRAHAGRVPARGAGRA